MKYIKLFSSDYASAWSYAITNQPHLCPANKAEIKRPGFVMDKGHCINSESEEKKSLDLLVQALAGPTQVNWTDHENKAMSTTIDYFALSTQPSQDLRTYFPTSFIGSCAVSYADPTLGGIFPKGDFNQITPKCSQQ